MAIAVRKTYACPTCGESFTKWGLCQSHVRASAPCREALGEKARDPDALQELCRVSAGGGAAVETGNGLSPLSPGSGAAAGPPGLPTAAATLPTCPAPGLQAPPALESNQDSLYAGEPVRQLSAHVKKRFRRAVTTGCLTEADLQELEAKYEELADHPAAVQLAAVDKFMRLGFEKLSRVTNKGAWLQCCLSFCVRTNLVDPPLGSSKPSAALVDALASQALLPDALSQDCWDQYAALTPELQYCVASAVRGSVLINAEGRLSEHFFHVASNERAIYRLEDAPAPRVEQLPQQVPWEALDGGLYHRLLQKMFFRQKVAPEQVLLRELNEVDGSVAPGDPGSLLYVHLATQQARLQGSAEVLSILHAAAASGLVRICARFIAEGLDVNERTGCQGFTPLHLASTSGEVEVVKLLLRQRADPNARDGDGHSALYGAVAKAVQLQKSEEGRDVAAATQECEQQAKVCMQLLLAGAENTPESNFVNDEEPQSAESLAQANGLTGILRIIWLHGLLKSFKQKFDVSEVAILELCELQFETARFVINMFEKHVSLSPEAAPTEFRALISSDFIKSRDKVQRYGNRLARRMELSKKAVDILADLPPAAGLHALSTWKIEEVVDHVYAVPDHLNAAKPAQEGAPAGTLDNSTEGTDGNSSIAKGAEGTKNGFTNGSSRHGRNEEPKLTGRIRKWDSERGFGFVVQDPREGEEHPKDVFVHRKNIVGSTPQNHIDLRENSRISYRLGEQDGRPRAHDVTTIDPDGYPLPIHFQSGDDSAVGLRDDALDGFDNEDDCDEERLTRMFMRHLRSKEVQDMARERRPECEAYLRCVGLRRHHAGRRDDSMWKREIEHRVDIFLERCTAPLHKRDFDFRVRRFLHEFSVHSGSVTRVSEALAMVETSTRGKRRDEVQNWPAYLATLLRRWDPKLYEVLAERDRRSRVEQKKAREANDSTMGESTLGVDASVLDGSEPGGGLAGGRSGHSSDESDHEDKRSGSDDDGVDTRRSSRSRGSSVGSRRSVSEGNAASSTDSDFDRQNAPPPPPKGPPPPPPMGPPPPPPVQRNGGAGPGGGRAPGLFAAAMKAAGAVAGGSSMGGGPLARKTFQ